jgi:hypothetical protein
MLCCRGSRGLLYPVKYSFEPRPHLPQPILSEGHTPLKVSQGLPRYFITYVNQEVYS